MTKETEAEDKTEVEALDAGGSALQPIVLQSPFMDQELDVYLATDVSCDSGEGVD